MPSNEQTFTPPPSFGRGPSWNDCLIQDPVLVVRTTLGPRPDEEEHLLVRCQFDVHLGRPMPVELTRDGKKLTRVVHFGDVKWTAAGDACRGRWRRARDMGFLSLSGQFVQRTADEAEMGDLPESADLSGGDPLTRELMLALVQRASSDRLYAETLASSLVVHLLRSSNRVRTGHGIGTGKLGQTQLQRAMEYVESRLGGEVDLESWAKEAGLSPYHFARVFKRTTGLAPHQFVQRKRIERAKSLLVGSEVPLSSLAYSLGFANQSHFHRVFRQQTQMTPGEWRSSMGV